MAQRKHLREVRAVRVAVQVDAFDRQRIEHRRQIVGGERRAVEGDRASERAPAVADVVLRERRGVLQLRAVDRARASGATVVHDQHVVARAQRREQREILFARVRGRIAGTALGRNQRARGRPGEPSAGSTRSRLRSSPARRRWDRAAATASRTRAPALRQRCSVQAPYRSVAGARRLGRRRRAAAAPAA